MLEKTGIPSLSQIKSCFPEESVLIKPKAIIECYQEIPCNPCSTCCPFDAITIGEDINQRPVVNAEKCTGCAICVYHCPGLAIVVSAIKEGNAIFKIPYEFIPIPEKDEIWHALDRAGNIISECKILNVQNSPKQEKTKVITVELEKKHLYDFITIRSPYESR